VKKNKRFMTALALALLLAGGQLMAYQPPAKKSSLRSSWLKRQFCLRGGLNGFSAHGAESDYEAGMNDFPVTPAFRSPVIGFSLATFTSPGFALGLDVRYGFSARVDLRDPVDPETITADTPKNLTAAVAIYKYFRLSGRLQCYASLGGGMEILMAGEKEYVSDLGSKIVIAAPARAVSPLAAGGAGLHAMLSRSLGLALELHAAAIFRKKFQMLASPSLALVLKF